MANGEDSALRDSSEQTVRVALVQNSDFGLWHFHGSLVTALRDAGAEVWAITPPGPFCQNIELLGAHHESLGMARYVDPWADLAMLVRLVRLFREIRPDVVHTITIKPNTIGVLAASFAGVPRIVSQVPGLGYVFDSRNTGRSMIVRAIVKFLYRIAFRKVERVWFVNPDDFQDFLNWRLIAPGKGVVIRSAGVSLSHYAPAQPGSPDNDKLREELGIPRGWLVVLLAGRMIWSKGIREFVEAASIVSRDRENVMFILAGPLEPGSPDPVPEEYLRESENPHLKWLGFRTDMPRILQLADLVVLISSYREGVPTILLEALATGKPIITTETPGCREVVEAGSNGFFVPPHDRHALATAVQIVLDDESLRIAFGDRSRLKSEEFSEDKVMDTVLKELYPELGSGLAAGLHRQQLTSKETGRS
jgi:N,N'-diacetylbacillosaminyl-diphospho-undecaprenol alpha-1,3-N-acetylgalactosaminyltransferase